MSALPVFTTSPDAAAIDLPSVIASLPVSLCASDGPADALVAIDGAAGWPQRVADARHNGALGVVLVHPEPVPTDQVPAITDTPLVVDHRFAGNPVLANGVGLLADWRGDVLIEVASTVPDRTDLPRTLIDQFAILHRLGQPARDAQRLVWDDAGSYVRGATTCGLRFLLSAHVSTGVPRYTRVRAMAPDRSIDVELPDPITAQPARLITTTSNGAVLAPTVWETSHRVAWRRLHAAVTAGAPAPDLTDLAAHLTVAQPVLPTS